MATKKTKDLPPKSSDKVKAGSGGFERKEQDNLTLVRGAKPINKRDLPPRKEIKGGGKKKA